MTEQQMIESDARGFAPPHAPLAMPKQVLHQELGLLRWAFGALFTLPAWRRAGQRRAG
jgi:hypothetical protein